MSIFVGITFLMLTRVVWPSRGREKSSIKQNSDKSGYYTLQQNIPQVKN